MHREPHIGHRRMSRRLGWWAAAAAAVLIACACLEARADSPRRSVTGDAKAVSVAASSAPLPLVLQEVADTAGVRLVLEPSLEARVAEQLVTITLERLRPEDALRRLLPGSDLMLVYSGDGSLVGAQAYMAAAAGADSARATSTGSRKPAAPAKVVTEPPSATPATAEDRALVDRLRREAVSHPEAERRAAAIEELSGRDDERLVRDTAIEILARDRDPRVLEAALDAVSSLESVPLDQIAQFASASRETELRIQAIDILGDRGGDDPRVRGWLQSLSTTDGDDDVRSAARSVLDRRDTR